MTRKFWDCYGKPLTDQPLTVDGPVCKVHAHESAPGVMFVCQHHHPKLHPTTENSGCRSARSASPTWPRKRRRG